MSATSTQVNGFCQLTDRSLVLSVMIFGMGLRGGPEWDITVVISVLVFQFGINQKAHMPFSFCTPQKSHAVKVVHFKPT